MYTSNFSLGFLNMSLWITVEVALVIQFFLENHFFGDLTINSKHFFLGGGGVEVGRGVLEFNFIDIFTTTNPNFNPGNHNN